MSDPKPHNDGEPLRILHCLRAPVGGLFRHVRDLVEEQAALGHSVGVVCSAEAGDPLTEQHLLKLQRFCDLGLHRLPMQRVPGLADLSMIWRVRHVIQTCAPDILHGHGAKGGVMSRLAPAPRGTRRFYTPHGGSVHVDPETAVGLAVSLAERYMLPRTSGICFESAFARRKFEERFGSLPCAATIVHNGVAPSEFKPISPADDAADFLFVGEIRRLKGVFTLVDAFADVLATKPSATLALVGSGPDEEELGVTIRQMELHTNIRRYPATPMQDALKLGRCGVMPSHHDSLPYVALEMIAAGRPLIATHVGGIPEIYGEAQDLLIPSEDPDALAAALNRWLQNPERYRRRMEQVRDRVRHQFATDAMAARIAAFYDNPTGAKKPTGLPSGVSTPLASQVESTQ